MRNMKIENLEYVESFLFSGLGFRVCGQDGCRAIYRTADAKGVAIEFDDGSRLMHFPTDMGIPVYYPLPDIALPDKISAVLMDLDGTSVKSEHFWVWVIQEVLAALRNEPDFVLLPEDIPFVSGYSVSEHLRYGLDKYCTAIPRATLKQARDLYFEIVRRELQNVLDGKPVVEPSFEPAPHLKEFLLELKERHVKIALVSSGLYEKAIPEIKAAFEKIGLGDPLEFYDAIITAGFRVCKGQVGTLGELAPKPHPWLYAEALHGLDTSPDEVIGIEDSGAGILSLVTAGIPAIGLAGGNIEQAGQLSLCEMFCQDLGELLNKIRSRI